MNSVTVSIPFEMSKSLLIRDFDSGYVVLGSTVEKITHDRYRRRGNHNADQTVESFIKNKDGEIVKSIVSPNVLTDDEANEIEIEVFKGTENNINERTCFE